MSKERLEDKVAVVTGEVKGAIQAKLKDANRIVILVNKAGIAQVGKVEEENADARIARTLQIYPQSRAMH